jgi:hypothetical protein
MKAWSNERGRFIGALTLFLIWVGTLTVLAVVSSERPKDHSHAQPASTQGTTPAATAKPDE